MGCECNDRRGEGEGERMEERKTTMCVSQRGDRRASLLAHKVAKGRRQHRFGCLRGASCLCLVRMHACPVAHMYVSTH